MRDECKRADDERKGEPQTDPRDGLSPTGSVVNMSSGARGELAHGAKVDLAGPE